MVIHYRQGGQAWQHLDYRNHPNLESKCLVDLYTDSDRQLEGDNDVLYFYLSSE